MLAIIGRRGRTMASTEFSGFYKLSPEERRKRVADLARLSDAEVKLLEESDALFQGSVGRMVENHIGTMPVPLGVAVNFLINGREYVVPMAVEEPSVIAAASNAAKTIGECGGFNASSTEPVMIGQIQVLGLEKPEAAVNAILREKKSLLKAANEQDEVLVNRGGGARDLEARVVGDGSEAFVVVHLLVDVRDAMGANIVNTMAEAVSKGIEGVCGGKTGLRIVSNLAAHRLARAEAVVKKEVVGADVVDGVVQAYSFAAADRYRCATHNKGIMNGIDAVVLATGNDWRAVEAGAHAYAAMKGYAPLAKWKKTQDGDLVGSIELPLAVGIVGGAIRSHPLAGVCLKILGVKSARELSEVIASVGLAQNFAALKALSTEGIQKGHMRLHARNIAILAGAEGKEIETLVEKLKNEERITVGKAKEILNGMRESK